MGPRDRSPRKDSAKFDQGSSITMPLIHERAFRVRNVECDAHGVLTPANMLRYMQEAAMDASTAAGYSVAWYNDHARMWLIRETDLAIARWPGMDATVTVTTWVADFRRVRSRRAYELRCEGALVARAFTDWVYLDTATMRPTTAPEVMVAAFWPDGPPADTPPREPFPAVGDVPDDAFGMQRLVLWSDLDQAAHVNNAIYLAAMEDCAALAPGSGVLAPDPDSDAAPAPRRYRIQYREPALLGDTLAVRTWVTGAGATSARRWYVVTRAGGDALLAQAVVAPLAQHDR